MSLFTLTANCEIIIQVEAETLDEAIDIAYETPVGFWEFTSDYPEFVEEAGLPTMEELEKQQKKEPNDSGSTESGPESSLLS